jgi:hypothetical protein
VPQRGAELAAWRDALEVTALGSVVPVSPVVAAVWRDRVEGNEVCWGAPAGVEPRCIAVKADCSVGWRRACSEVAKSAEAT